MGTHAPAQWKPEKIVSGGQTGVDRAALDIGIALNLAIGGYCPKGRRCEDGVIPDRYPMIELYSRDYSVRTKKNIVESDGTLIIAHGELSGGTLLTHRLAQKHQKPVFVAQVAEPQQKDIQRWCSDYRIHTLNIAGPREEQPGTHVYETTYRYLIQLLGA